MSTPCGGFNQPIWTNLRQMDHLPYSESRYPSSCKCHKLLGKPGAAQRKPPNTKSLVPGRKGRISPARKTNTAPWKDGKCCCDEMIHCRMGTFWIPNVNSCEKFHLVSCKKSHIHLLHARSNAKEWPPQFHGEIRDFQVFSGILFPTEPTLNFSLPEVARFGETRHQWFCLNVDHFDWIQATHLEGM